MNQNHLYLVKSAAAAAGEPGMMENFGAGVRKYLPASMVPDSMAQSEGFLSRFGQGTPEAAARDMMNLRARSLGRDIRFESRSRLGQQAMPVELDPSHTGRAYRTMQERLSAAGNPLSRRALADPNLLANRAARLEAVMKARALRSAAARSALPGVMQMRADPAAMATQAKAMEAARAGHLKNVGTWNKRLGWGAGGAATLAALGLGYGAYRMLRRNPEEERRRSQMA